MTFSDKYKEYRKGRRVKYKGDTGTITRRRHLIHPLAGRQEYFDVEVKFDGGSLILLPPKDLILEGGQLEAN